MGSESLRLRHSAGLSNAWSRCHRTKFFLPPSSPVRPNFSPRECPSTWNNAPMREHSYSPLPPFMQHRVDHSHVGQPQRQQPELRAVQAPGNYPLTVQAPSAQRSGLASPRTFRPPCSGILSIAQAFGCGPRSTKRPPTRCFCPRPPRAKPPG